LKIDDLRKKKCFACLLQVGWPPVIVVVCVAAAMLSDQKKTVCMHEKLRKQWDKYQT